MPAHATCKRVFRLLDPVPFQGWFLRWRRAVAEATQGEGSAVDGKPLRRSFAKGPAKRAVHLVSAGAPENGGGLGQRRVEAKSNESTAFPEFLELLARKGGLVTSAAMGWQRALARQMVERPADDVLARKGNPPTLEPAGAPLLVRGPAAEAHRPKCDSYAHSERGQGRVETRCSGMTDPMDTVFAAAAWPGRQSSGRVEAARTLAGTTTIEQRFSLPSLQPDAQEFARAVRNPWDIENRLQGTLDVPFRADPSRLRKAHGP